jgi:hypothetical protein
MELNNFSTINLSQKEIKDIQQFCELNKIEDIPSFLHTCAWKGYEVEKYGLLGKMGGIQEKRVEIEVIREKRVEIPVEVIKEVVKIEYVEVPVEVIKEVIKEVPVEKIVTIYDNSNENELSEKIAQLESEKKIFSTKIEELESELVVFSTKMTEMENIFQNNNNTQQLQNTIQNLMKTIRDKNIEIDGLKKQLVEQQKNNEVNERAKYLRSSNLDDNLYK